MGRLAITEFLTLDGVGQAPGGPDEDLDGGFAHGGWQAPFVDASAGAAMLEHHRAMDAMLLGRRTFELFAGYWPHQAPDGNPFAALMNDTPKYVASRTLSGPQQSWSRTEVLTGDLASAVAAVKDRHREVHVIGSLDLARSLLREGLADRLDLWLHPLVLGTGKRLFADGVAPTQLRLTESQAYDTGVVHLVYETAGTPSTGLRVDDEVLDRIPTATA